MYRVQFIHFIGAVKHRARLYEHHLSRVRHLKQKIRLYKCDKSFGPPCIYIFFIYVMGLFFIICVCIQHQLIKAACEKNRKKIFYYIYIDQLHCAVLGICIYDNIFFMYILNRIDHSSWVIIMMKWYTGSTSS